MGDGYSGGHLLGWVLYVSDESLNSPPETNIALYVYLKKKKILVNLELLLLLLFDYSVLKSLLSTT